MRDFSCQVRKHDSHHIEMKTLLPIPLKGKGKYDLSFYFFTPGQLQINKKNVGVSKVLKHFQTYTRFSSPILPLGGLIDEENELSPFYRLKQQIVGLQSNGNIKNKSVIYELQTLVNAFRSDIKGFIALVTQICCEEHTALIHYKEQIDLMVEQTNTLLNKVQELFPSFLHQRIPAELRTALEWTDEAVTLIAEQNMLELRMICKDEELFKDKVPMIDEFIGKVESYRILQEYASAYDVEQGNNGERVAYRESILKKWAQSAMYMKAEESKTPSRMNHILAGTAAALAMTFAVFASLYAEAIFIKNSAPWAMIIIISYVFKDRIKEILRGVFGRLLPRLLADRIMRLIDPATDRDIAKSEVLIRFGLDKNQPEAIQHAREMNKNPFSSILPPQDVLHYNRIVTLKSRVLKDHRRLESITEVTRVRIDEWLKSMDDPKDSIYKLIDGERQKMKSGRVYHIHLIASLKEHRKKAEPRLYHYCLVMNRNGLIRIENR